MRLIAQKSDAICLENSINLVMRYMPSKWNISDGLTRASLRSRFNEVIASVDPNAVEVTTESNCQVIDAFLQDFATKAPECFKAEVKK